MPEGVTAVPAELSVTVTLHAEPWLITTEVAQVTVVVVVLRVNVKATVVVFDVEPLIAVTVTVVL